MSLTHRIALAALTVSAITGCAPGLRPAADLAPTRADAPAYGFRDPAVRIIPMNPGELPTESESSADLVAETMAPVWDIDVQSFEANDRVEFYLNRFSGSARGTFREWLERGTRFETLIRDALRAQDLPEDLMYLALIESGFDPHAYSRSAAVGMWQFMAPTATGYGLRLDWWVDERRDPVASTYAAARFLKELRKQFGSDYLAAAAYNGGPGRLARGLTRHAGTLEGTTGDSTFFALTETGYLPKETSNYVPQLIAAAMIGKEPERYGMTVVPRESFAYDSVEVAGGTPLSGVAAAAGVPVSEVMALNTHLLRGVTPPDSKGWFARIPTGRAAGFAVAWDGLGADARAAYALEATKKGETLAAFAKRNGRTAREIAAYNPGLKAPRGILAGGQRLRVPSRAVVDAAPTLPDPALDRAVAAATPPPPPRTHKVASGDTLDGIARKYGTSVTRLQSLNKMGKKTIIRPGQKLVVSAA